MAFFLTACALIEISYADQPASMGEPSAAATGLAVAMRAFGASQVHHQIRRSPERASVAFLQTDGNQTANVSLAPGGTDWKPEPGSNYSGGMPAKGPVADSKNAASVRFFRSRSS